MDGDKSFQKLIAVAIHRLCEIMLSQTKRRNENDAEHRRRGTGRYVYSSVNLPPSMFEEVDRICDERFISRSHYIRDAIAEKLDREGVMWKK
jgi:Ribbon-helix-helix protein, copG family